ncbi:MAG: NADH-quinone oxidoreductase subunit NuoH [Acidimicrobiia bacterium]
MDLIDFLIILGRVLATFVLLLTVTVFNVWIERKVISDMQSRIGPNRAGPWGILQTVADGLKLFFKEQINPKKAEMGAFMLAPFLAVIPAFLLFMVIPWGAPFQIGDRTIHLQGTDLNIGVLFILAMSSLAVYAVVLAGWSSGSKYPLLGGVRATAQAISYEAALGLSIVAVVLWSATTGDTGGGTLSLQELVNRQSGTLDEVIPQLGFITQFLPRWNVFPQIVAFVIFVMAAVAETNRAPFDLVEAEQELVGGFHTEYSGMRFAMYFLAEYVNIFSMSALAATLFLGGWNGPTFGLESGIIAAALPTVWFLIKTYAIFFIFIWIRATLPRLRYDQLMTLGWKRLIPGALGWLLLSTVVIGVRRFGLPWA